MKIDELITSYNLDAHRDFITKSAAQCIRLSAELTRDEDIPIGGSKFGGFPDLPSGFEWPSCQPYPMTHVAQLNCDEVANLLPNNRLPKTGVLHFFVQTDEEGYLEFPLDGEKTWSVFHSDTESLVRTEPPEDSEFHYDARALSFRAGLSLPDTYDGVFDGFSESDMENYNAIQQELGGHEHQVFGFPSVIQPTDFHGTELIFQILSEEDDFMFGDCGYLYFTRKSGAPALEIDLRVDF